MASPSSSSNTAIECNDLTVRHGQVVALDRVSISVGSGERVALVGPSGSGKTSLVHVIAGLVDPTAGEVLVLGNDPGALRGSALRNHRKRVGIISQHLGLAPSLSVVHSVNGGLLGSWSTGRALASLVRPSGTTEVHQALEAVGLSDRVRARTGDLSGGEQQRVAIARTLLQAPELILADEPTSSVDPTLADQVMSLLCPENPPWTVLVSVHDPDLALRHADRLIGLALGRVVFDKPTSQIDRTEIDRLYRRA